MYSQWRFLFLFPIVHWYLPHSHENHGFYSNSLCPACQHMPAVPTLSTLKEEDHKFESSLSYIVKQCFKKQKERWANWWIEEIPIIILYSIFTWKNHFLKMNKLSSQAPCSLRQKKTQKDGCPFRESAAAVLVSQ